LFFRGELAGTLTVARRHPCPTPPWVKRSGFVPTPDDEKNGKKRKLERGIHDDPRPYNSNEQGCKGETVKNILLPVQETSGIILSAKE